MDRYEDKYSVEVYDNGIAIKKDCLTTGDTVRMVSLDMNKARDIGEMLIASITYVMNVECCNKVSMRIEIVPDTGKEVEK